MKTALTAPARRDARRPQAGAKRLKSPPRLFVTLNYPLGEILAAVVAASELTVADITGPSRKAAFVKARHVFCWLAYNLTPAPLYAIAAAVNLTDHSTIGHARQQVQNSIDTGDGYFSPLLDQVLPALLRKRAQGVAVRQLITAPDCGHK